MAVVSDPGPDPEDVIVREPGPADVQVIEAMERMCFPDPWPGGVILGELGAPGRFHRVLVTSGGEIVGYLFAAWQYLDLHILDIATHPDHRRRGHARRLLELARAHAETRGGESVTLEVRPTNAAAIALYEALGYRKVGLRRRYYGDGEDALVMTLPLRIGPSAV